MTSTDTDTADTPTRRNRKSPNRPEPKYAFGDRGFHPGSYPKVGPFDILRQRPLRKGVKEAEFREGRGFYNLGHRAEKSPPAEGWDTYLAQRYGEGTFKILHHNPGDKFNNRSLFFIDREQVARLDRQAIDNPPQRPDDDDDDDPRESRSNPPGDPIASFVEQLQALRQAEQLLRPEPEPAPLPPPPPGFGELIARSLMSNPQVMAQIAQAVMPRPNPPPPPPPAHPADAIVARIAREQGLTPEEAIDALTMAGLAKKENAERAGPPDYSRGEPGPAYPPTGSDFPP